MEILDRLLMVYNVRVPTSHKENLFSHVTSFPGACFLSCDSCERHLLLSGVGGHWTKMNKYFHIVIIIMDL